MGRLCLFILKPCCPPSLRPLTKNRNFINAQLTKAAIEEIIYFLISSFAADLERVSSGRYCFVCQENVCRWTRGAGFSYSFETTFGVSSWDWHTARHSWDTKMSYCLRFWREDWYQDFEVSNFRISNFSSLTAHQNPSRETQKLRFWALVHLSFTVSRSLGTMPEQVL